MTIDSRTTHLIAVVADVHPRTVRRAFAGEPIRDAMRRRIEDAIDRIGSECPPGTDLARVQVQLRPGTMS